MDTYAWPLQGDMVSRLPALCNGEEFSFEIGFVEDDPFRINPYTIRYNPSRQTLKINNRFIDTQISEHIYVFGKDHSLWEVEINFEPDYDGCVEGKVSGQYQVIGTAEEFFRNMGRLLIPAT